MNMPMNFGQKVEEKSFDNETIPKDTLVWCNLNVREIKHSRDTNGQYLDIELTVDEGQPYAKRKIWDKIANPFDTNNSEEWRNMGYGAIRRILEACRGATPDNPNSYVLNQLTDLSGLRVPICVGIEKGTQQYPNDKNRAEYLSPYSSIKKVVKCFELLNQGQHQYGDAKQAAQPQQGNLLQTGQATPPPAQMPAAQPAAVPAAQPPQDPNWLAQQQQPAQNAGFQQGAAPAQQAAPPATPAANQPPATAPAATLPATNVSTFPSNQGADGGWPAQFPQGGGNTGQ